MEQVESLGQEVLRVLGLPAEDLKHLIHAHDEHLLRSEVVTRLTQEVHTQIRIDPPRALLVIQQRRIPLRAQRPRPDQHGIRRRAQLAQQRAIGRVAQRDRAPVHRRLRPNG